jgi:hypothetical protein
MRQDHRASKNATGFKRRNCGKQVYWGAAVFLLPILRYSVLSGCSRLALSTWIALNFFPVGWTQLNAVYEHEFAYARSVDFYNSTLVWQWMRLPGDVLFAIAALMMSWDFITKTGPLFPSVARGLSLPPLRPFEQPGE